MAVGLDPGATTTAGPTSAVDPLSEQFRPRWHAESVAKLHPRLGEPGIEHTVTIGEPPTDPAGGTQLPLI
jgi:hypothetical protein